MDHGLFNFGINDVHNHTAIIWGAFEKDSDPGQTSVWSQYSEGRIILNMIIIEKIRTSDKL